MITPEDLNREFSLRQEELFFRPVANLVKNSEKIYSTEALPPHFGEARTFARQLWTCCDNEEMKGLALAYREGAAQASFLLSLHVTKLVAEGREGSLNIQESPGKPFAAVASFLLERLDEIEETSPGKTIPLQ